jgi:predicted acyltransferase (DUF342 family)
MAAVFGGTARAAIVSDFAILAEGNVTLSKDVQVFGGLVGSGGDMSLNNRVRVLGAEVGGELSTGHSVTIVRGVKAGGDVELGPDVQITGDVQAGDDFSAGPGSDITGDLTVTGQVRGIATNAKVTGSVETETGVPIVVNLPALPPPVAFTHGSNDLSIPSLVFRSFQPGLFDDVRIGSTSTINVFSGDYLLDSLVVDDQALIRLNAANGPIRFLVQDELHLGQRVNFQLISGKAEEIFFQAGDFFASDSAVILGTIFSLGDVEIGSNSSITGRLRARGSIHLRSGALVDAGPEQIDGAEPGIIPAPGALPAGLFLLSLFGVRRVRRAV